MYAHAEPAAQPAPMAQKGGASPLADLMNRGESVQRVAELDATLNRGVVQRQIDIAEDLQANPSASAALSVTHMPPSPVVMILLP